jgi:predicted MFS family arabinose efflux permease
MTPILIQMVGWRAAWMVCGGFGIITGLLMILTVYEPRDVNAIVLTKDQNEKDAVKSKAIYIL